MDRTTNSCVLMVDSDGIGGQKRTADLSPPCIVVVSAVKSSNLRCAHPGLRQLGERLFARLRSCGRLRGTCVHLKAIVQRIPEGTKAIVVLTVLIPL